MSNQAQGADGAGTKTTSVTYTQAENDEAYSLGHRDGYSEGVLDAANHAGLQLEYGVSTDPEHHVPGPGDMLERISEHTDALASKAALASPRADSAERTTGDVLAEACKPWAHYTGEPPDDGSPLSGVFVAGMTHTERLLAKLLDVTHYEGGDGSEDFDNDATQTLRNILTGARLWDADENRPASPAPAATPGVPDSVRALSEARTDAIQKQCAHYGDEPARCLITERSWAPGAIPKRCTLCPDAALSK